MLHPSNASCLDMQKARRHTGYGSQQSGKSSMPKAYILMKIHLFKAAQMTHSLWWISSQIRNLQSPSKKHPRSTLPQIWCTLGCRHSCTQFTTFLSNCLSTTTHGSTWPSGMPTTYLERTCMAKTQLIQGSLLEGSRAT